MYIKNRVVVRIIGKSPERFIIKLKRNSINIYNINKNDNDNIDIEIDYVNFDKILKLKTIYDVSIVKYLGFEKNKRFFLKYYHLILLAIISILMIYFSSGFITDVIIISNDNVMKKKINSILIENDISKYKYKKNYEYLQRIKEIIINKYHNEIEWIEIEKKGTKYIVKYEPRIIKKKNIEKRKSNIVASKNAIVRNVFASSGQVIKNKNDYVNKGDIIISGLIYSNEEIKNIVSASGKVYGEVWYIIKVVYPFNYYEQKKTGKKKTIYSIKFLNNRFDIFNFNPFNDKIIKESVLLKNNIIPFKFVKEKQEEIKIKTSMNVIEEVKINAINLAYERINEKLKDDEYIINHKVIDSKIIDKGIEMKLFFSVCENIGKEEIITDMKEVE